MEKRSYTKDVEITSSVQTHPLTVQSLKGQSRVLSKFSYVIDHDLLRSCITCMTGATFGFCFLCAVLLTHIFIKEKSLRGGTRITRTEKQVVKTFQHPRYHKRQRSSRLRHSQRCYTAH